MQNFCMLPIEKMFSCNCAVYNKKENKFIKKQGAEKLLSNL